MLKFQGKTKKQLLIHTSYLLPLSLFHLALSPSQEELFFRAFFRRKVTQVYPSGARTRRFLAIKSAAGFHENFPGKILGYSADFTTEILAFYNLAFESAIEKDSTTHPIRDVTKALFNLMKQKYRSKKPCSIYNKYNTKGSRLKDSKIKQIIDKELTI